MRLTVITSIVIANLMSASPSFAEDKAETGIIKSYECGDNCYLTITTDKGEELTALCAADACGAWNEQAEMPADLIGKKVEVSVGSGKQYDGAGNEMGDFPSFTKVTVESAAAPAEGTKAAGVIKSYECGDNCYLTITTDKGEELQALCAADECNVWNEVAAMPDEMIGRTVEVTIESGKQYDGDGNEMGDFPSFTKVTVAPL